ncbi:MAG: hypothetical protein K8S55_00760 [Phycisphaerae bacterium]|nr:hypothetical protein [Phycisphaerae bacterium]
MMRSVLLMTIVALLFCVGCEELSNERELELEKQRDVARKQVKELTGEVENLSARLATQDEHVKTLQALGGEKRMATLFTVDKIELGRYTGGIDTDKKPGDDAIKIFLLPEDADGSTLKAAGSVKIQLFDLAQPEGKGKGKGEGKNKLFAEYTYPVKDIAKHWHGGMLTYHYSFLCGWEKPPAHADITVRVEFTDYLTGKTFTAQKLCKIKLPPK